MIFGDSGLGVGSLDENQATGRSSSESPAIRSAVVFPDAEAAQGRRNHGRILIVEDQGIVATDIERCLEDAGFEVTGIATSMQDAIREASSSRPDLVLMDIRIQGNMDGIAAAEYLHGHFGLPVVYLTAHDDGDTLARAKGTEPMAFLIKPFKPAELTSTVEIALRRSRAEKVLQQREGFFLSAMEAIGDAVLTADAQGRVRFMNGAAERLTGCRQEMALGRPATDIVRVTETGGAERFGALLHTGPAQSGDSPDPYRILSHDGGEHWLNIKTASIAGATDSNIRIVVMRDVTAAKQSEQALRRQADLLDQSQDAVFTWDERGAIHYWNRGAHALYGYEQREALGCTVKDLLSPADPASGEAARAALQRDGRWSGELRRRTKNGRDVIVESVLVALQEDGSKIMLETDRDITERKGRELEIERLNRELRARVGELTALNQELDSFNYSISHDLRAPLRHIDSYTRILHDKLAPNITTEDRQDMERVRGAVVRMGRMVDGLLELSRTSRSEPARQHVPLLDLVEDVLAELKADARDGAILWRIGKLPVIDCDPKLVRHVFVNLLTNALKFSRNRKPAEIEVGQVPSDRQTVLFVRDNGAGFDMKYADKLFGVFQRLHRREDFEGTGVGLAIVQRIVHKHGGRIWPEAEIDRGATFYFTLGPPGGVGRRPCQMDRAEVSMGGKQC